MIMGVYKWEKYSLRPKQRKWYQKLGSWIIDHYQLVIYGGLTLGFILFLAVLQAQAQADYLLIYGSG